MAGTAKKAAAVKKPVIMLADLFKTPAVPIPSDHHVAVVGTLVRAGDTLVIAASPGDQMTPEVVDKIRRTVAASMPGVSVAVIATTQVMVYRPSEG